MNKSNKQTGAALIMTVLIVSIFSVATLAVGKVLTSEVRLNSDYGNHEVAYWAAEAGIEKGLLFLRENQTPELPDNSNYESDLFLKTNLNGNIASASRSTLPDQSNDQERGEVLNYLKVYDQVLLDDTEYILEKDQSVTLRKINQANLQIKWYLLDSNDRRVSNSNIDYDKNRLYVRRNKDDGNFETITIPGDTQEGYPQGSVTNIDIEPSDEFIQLKAFTQEGYKIKLEVSVSDGSSLVGGRYIYIESIGYYNGVRRKVLAKIDREEVMAPNIMDYVIFTKDSIE